MIPAGMISNHQGVHQQEWFHHVLVKNLESSPPKKTSDSADSAVPSPGLGIHGDPLGEPLKKYAHLLIMFETTKRMNPIPWVFMGSWGFSGFPNGFSCLLRVEAPLAEVASRMGRRLGKTRTSSLPQRAAGEGIRGCFGSTHGGKSTIGLPENMANSSING